MTCVVTRASHVTVFRTGFRLIGHCLDLTTTITLLSHAIPKLVLHFPSFRYNPHTQESFHTRCLTIVSIAHALVYICLGLLYVSPRHTYC